MFGRSLALAVVAACPAILAAQGVQPASRTQFDPALLAGLRARAIGPAGMSGRIAAIDAFPGDPGLVYVGAATGGVWRSRNGGLTWTPVFDDQPVQAIGAVAVAPGNRDVVWVGTGEGNPRNSASIGNGVYRSRDGGETWEHLGLEKSERIHRIVLDPRRPDVAFVAALGPLWSPGGERGVYKTEDGGKSWRRVLGAGDSTGCADLVADPRNPDKMFAALWEHRRRPWDFRSGGKESGLYRTVDGGETWERLGPGDGLPEGELGRIGIAIAPSDPDVVYVLVEAAKNVLLRSDDGGRRFRVVNDKSDVAPRPFYYCDIRVDPERPDRIYNLHTIVSVSDDGGKTFRPLVPFRDVHPDHHALWIDPNDARHLLLGNDGGVAESRDRGATWRFVANLPVCQFYHVDVDLDVPYHVYGGMQDNGSWRGPADVWENGGIRNHHWNEVCFGDGFRTLPDPQDSLRGYAMSQGGGLVRWDLRTGERRSIKPAPHDDTRLRFNWDAAIAPDPFQPGTIWFGSQFVHRSRDRGLTWEVVSPDLTTNRSEWQQQAQSGGLTPDVTGAENFTTLVALAPSPVQEGVVWAGSDDGRVHVTRDGGRTWTSVEDAIQGVPRHAWVSHIEPGRFDAAVAFVTFDDHRRGDFEPYVFATADYGRTWRSLSTPEIEGYAHVIAQDLVDPDLLFLGTEFGLWFTVDGGRAWHRFTHGIPKGVAVMGLAIHPREHDLVVGTHGRGAFVIDDIRPLRELVGDDALALQPEAGLGADGEPAPAAHRTATLRKPLHVFTAPPAWQHTVAQSTGPRFPGHGEFRGTTRPYGALITFSLAGDDLPHPDAEEERRRKNERNAAGGREAAGDPAAAEGAETAAEGKKPPRATIEVRDAEGLLVRTFRRPVHAGINRVTWDLRAKGYKSPRRRDADRPRDDEDEPAGAEVAPGDYEVTVRFGEHEGKTKVTVLADPRVEVSAEDRAAKAAALERAFRLRAALADVLEGIEAVRADLDALEKKVRPAGGQVAGDATAAKELTGRIKALRAGLTELEKAVWTPPDTKGITDDEHALRAIGTAISALGSSWHRPTAAELRFLEIGAGKVEAAVQQANALFTTEVPAIRKLAGDAGIGLFPERPAITVQ